jgi:hypothetical protein
MESSVNEDQPHPPTNAPGTFILKNVLYRRIRGRSGNGFTFSRARTEVSIPSGKPGVHYQILAPREQTPESAFLIARLDQKRRATMQRLAVRRDTIAINKLDNDQILYFTLQNALPVGHTLALNVRLGTLSYLHTDEGCWPRMLVQQQFTNSELSLLRPLLEHYPHYCPHEVMFANFYNGVVTEKTIARARERLQEAMDYGTWDHEMRPVRNVLSRTRLKLKDFGLDVLSILETGYMLMVSPRPVLEE